LRDGEILWRQGDQAGGVVVLESGELDLFEESLSGDVVIFHTLPAGSLLGEMSALDHRPHSASVRARGDCRIRQLSAEEFLQALRAQPELTLSLLRMQSERVRRLTRRLAQVGLQPVLVRLVRVLLERSGGGASLEVTHHELAARAATTRESVTKAMRLLAGDGLVRTERGRVHLLDRKGLAGILLEFDGDEPGT
jgi:CRP-like cAMP-binding protein